MNINKHNLACTTVTEPKMSKRKRKTDIGTFSDETMRSAVKLVLSEENPMSLREAAAAKGVKYQTLAR